MLQSRAAFESPPPAYMVPMPDPTASAGHQKPASPGPLPVALHRAFTQPASSTKRKGRSNRTAKDKRMEERTKKEKTVERGKGKKEWQEKDMSRSTTSSITPRLAQWRCGSSGQIYLLKHPSSTPHRLCILCDRKSPSNSASTPVCTPRWVADQGTGDRTIIADIGQVARPSHTSIPRLRAIMRLALGISAASSTIRDRPSEPSPPDPFSLCSVSSLTFPTAQVSRLRTTYMIQSSLRESVSMSRSYEYASLSKPASIPDSPKRQVRRVIISSRLQGRPLWTNDSAA